MDNEKSREKVIETIKKLFALSGNNPNKNEAIAAALKAQQLMAIHNIDDIEIADEVKEETIEIRTCHVGTGKKWKYQLGDIIAKNFRCKCYYRGRWGICFYGYKSDTQIAEQVFLYLLKTGDKLANKYIRDYRRAFPCSSTKGLYNSFVVGFSKGIEVKMEKQCKALMIVIPEKVETTFSNFSENFKKRNSAVSLKNNFSKNAYQQGEYEGKYAMDGRELEEQENSQKLLEE